jgi:hypothetical protein
MHWNNKGFAQSHRYSYQYTIGTVTKYARDRKNITRTTFLTPEKVHVTSMASQNGVLCAVVKA